MNGNQATRFLLMRHAETEWNRRKLIQGQADSPLTEKGLAQARRWAESLAEEPLDLILSSEMGRARRTAALITEFLNLPLETDARLAEQDWGDWTGRTIAELRITDGAEVAAQEAAGWDFRPPGGEDRRSLRLRAEDALLAAATRHPGAALLVVTHEGVIKALIKWLAGRKYLPDEPRLVKKDHLHWLESENGRLRLVRVNARPLNPETGTP